MEGSPPGRASTHPSVPKTPKLAQALETPKSLSPLAVPLPPALSELSLTPSVLQGQSSSAPFTEQTQVEECASATYDLSSVPQPFSACRNEIEKDMVDVMSANGSSTQTPGHFEVNGGTADLALTNQGRAYQLLHYFDAGECTMDAEAPSGSSSIPLQMSAKSKDHEAHESKVPPMASENSDTEEKCEPHMGK